MAARRFSAFGGQSGAGEFVSQREPNVFPVFYYNDLLVETIGNGIGLNLFEPRYLKMCSRLYNDPRFLFMPNYEDYMCRVGDVGLVIRLTRMEQLPHGSVAVGGVATHFASVTSTWVEPDTKGLHQAQVVVLPDDVRPLRLREYHPVHRLFTERGWMNAWNIASRVLFLHEAAPGGELRLGANWPDRVFLVLGGSNSQRASEMIQDCLADAGVATGADRGTCLPAGAPGSPTGMRLLDLFGSITQSLNEDGRGVMEMVGLPQRLDANTWRLLLREARIEGLEANLGCMRMHMPTARLELCNLPSAYIEESLPLLEGGRGERGQKGDQVVARVSNGSNVLFFADPKSVLLDAESYAATLSRLLWRLNRPRLQLLLFARESGHGPLAALEEDAANVVCDFLARPPPGESLQGLLSGAWHDLRSRRGAGAAVAATASPASLSASAAYRSSWAVATPSGMASASSEATAARAGYTPAAAQCWPPVAAPASLPAPRPAISSPAGIAAAAKAVRPLPQASWQGQQ